MMQPRLLHVILLLAMMQAVSAFKWRCWFFCTEQTGVQNDYVSDRDTCREYAQLRAETDTSSAQPANERNRTAQLVAMFSSCMADRGWTVPDGKGNQGSVPANAATAAHPAGSATGSDTPIQSPGAAGVGIVAAPSPTGEQSGVAANMAQPSQDRDMVSSQRKNAGTSRAAECAFARHGAAYSSVSASRAQACDIECAEKLKSNPKSNPSACPPK